MLLVIEDLHWADASTRAFLRFLAAALADEPILVVATYRPDELHRRHPLRPLLAELERTQRARRVELPAAGARRAGRAARRPDRARRPPPTWSTACTRAARATRSTRRSCSPPGPTAAARCPPASRPRWPCGSSGWGPTRRTSCAVLSAAGELEHEALAAVAGLEPRALNEALREAVSSHIVQTGAGRPLPLPPRAAARGRVRRPAAGRARRAAPRARRRARAARGGRRARRRRSGRRASPTTTSRPATSRPRSPPPSGPAPRRWTCRPTRRARELFERALELWSRVPGRRGAGRRGRGRGARARRDAATCTRTTCRAPRRSPGGRSAAVDAAVEPRRSARLLGLLSRAEWASLRQDDAVDDDAAGARPPRPATGRAASGSGSSPSGPSASWCSRSTARPSAPPARRCEEQAALDAGDGVPQRRGRRPQRAGRRADRARRPRAGPGRAPARAGAWRARTTTSRTSRSRWPTSPTRSTWPAAPREALDVARRGYAELSGVGARRWLALGVSQFAFDAGHWEESAAAVADVDRRGPQTGHTELERRLRHAELALGRDERAAARGAPAPRRRARRGLPRAAVPRRAGRPAGRARAARRRRRRPRAPPSTRRSTGSSSARRTSCGSSAWPRPACSWRPPPPSGRATSPTPPRRRRRSSGPRR